MITEEEKAQDSTVLPNEAFDHKTPMVQASSKIDEKDPVTIEPAVDDQ